MIELVGDVDELLNKDSLSIDNVYLNYVISKNSNLMFYLGKSFFRKSKQRKLNTYDNACNCFDFKE
jgi:hypothetical protein